MSENNMNQELHDQPPEATTFGGLLRIARENKDLSIDQVSSQLRITPKQIEGLEADNYKVFPTPVYARAHLRSYARLLGVDESKVISMFNEALAPEDKDPRTFIRRTTQELAPYHEAQPKNVIGKSVAGLLFLAVICALGWMGYSYYTGSGQTSEEAATQTPAAVAPLADASGSSASEQKAESAEPAKENALKDTSVQAKAASATDPIGEAQKDAELKERLQKEAEAKAAAKAAEEKRLAEDAQNQSSAAAATSSAAATESQPLTLTHNDAEGHWELIVPKTDQPYKVTIGADGGECWFGIYQEKKLVHNAQLKSGEVRDYDVAYPFKVSVGNRAKGFVKINGQPVELNINNRSTSTVFTMVQK